MIINKARLITQIICSATLLVSANRCAAATSIVEEKVSIAEHKEVSNNQQVYYEDYTITYDDKIFDGRARTVRLFKRGWEMGDPSILLGSNEQLELHFDLLDGEFTNYQYKIIHCNANWEKSTLLEMDYLDGFNDNYIDFHAYSFNTLQGYVHYSQVFPNDDVRLSKSGNYIVIVYPENDEEHPIFTKRFYVTEDRFKLRPNVKYPSKVDDRYYKQEVDFDIVFEDREIINPYENIKLVLEQNHRTDNLSTGLSPNFVKENVLIYNYDDPNVFEGGNEFRNLDLTTTRSRTAQIARFEVVKDTMQAYVLKDIRRSYKKYLQFEDINGRYIVKTLDGNDFELESDYIMVHFTLPYEQPLSDGDVYIYGQLSDWKIKPTLRLTYSPTEKAYKGKAYLKQGFYNYNYMFVSNASKKANFGTVEGTHFETENEYIFKIYYRDPTQFYDRLMLYEIANSRDSF